MSLVRDIILRAVDGVVSPSTVVLISVPTPTVSNDIILYTLSGTDIVLGGPPYSPPVTVFGASTLMMMGI